MQILLIGISAGAAAALLFASLASCTAISIILVYLSPLPILIAGMGWNHFAGFAAIASGALSLGFIFNGYFAAAFLVGVGLPSWWLGYLALLARPAATE